ncbi:NERD domain-containing protein [Peribacillus glennii]|uniref:NERD domain-containing protein n=1 Tax=Peribacillus glennii TaxID=2303991 RepID=A0A372LIP5_9BACI|nr:NERD domain-containing protein [Peribacillus glennii]RFU66267.1 NERD domain-containing protein [Peribacillus glennii]
MGQLIKLQDYISRYEQDIYRYPTQFVRLKQQQWENLKAAFLAGELEQFFHDPPAGSPDEDWTQETRPGLMEKVRGIFSKAATKGESPASDSQNSSDSQENFFSLQMPTNIGSLDELKQNYLNQLLRFQMTWGSSTMYEKSFVDQSFFLDERLRFFLQRFPDTFLLLYKPVFLLKNAPVEVEVILLSPTDAWCLTFLEAEEDAVFAGSSERFWLKRHHQHKEKKVLNPMLAVDRMEKIAKQLFSLYDVSLPIKKAILSRNGYIDHPLAPYDVTLLDKRTFPEWFQKMRGLSSPLKHQQLKAAQALLDYCQTTSSRRLEWDVDLDVSEEENKL